MARTGSAQTAFRYIAEDDLTGYGESANRLVTAVRSLGASVEYRGWSGSGDQPRVLEHSRDPLPEFVAPAGAPTIAHLVPEHYSSVRKLFPGGPLIGHTVWETDKLPQHWTPLLNELAAVIVPTRWNRDVFAAGGVSVPIHVVPHVACDPVPGDRGASLDLPDEVVVFYTIATWHERKAPWQVLEAFLDAFTCDDPVILIIKTSPNTLRRAPDSFGATSPLSRTPAVDVTRIIRQHRRPPAVRVVADRMTQDQISGLHHRGDCYVSLSHGEGWGLGEFDACTYGNPVVAPRWGGPLDYLDPDGPLLIDVELVPPNVAGSSYTPDQRWVQPDLAHATELLRRVAADLAAARAEARAQRDRALAEFSGHRVAARFLAALGVDPQADHP